MESQSLYPLCPAVFPHLILALNNSPAYSLHGRVPCSKWDLVTPICALNTGKLQQDDLDLKFRVSLGCLVRPCPQNNRFPCSRLRCDWNNRIHGSLWLTSFPCRDVWTVSGGSVGQLPISINWMAFCYAWGGRFHVDYLLQVTDI